MDWKTILPILITAGVTILGWLVAHQFNAWRDRENKRRDQRIQYLVEAFRRLGRANHHPRLYEIADELQSAITDIQLFGTEAQIRNVIAVAKALAENGSASMDDLLFSLREDLRKELRLPPITERIWCLRVEPAFQPENKLSGQKQRR